MENSRARTDAEFSDFVAGSRERLARLAIMLTSDRTAAEDLLQDALLKTYLAWSRIGPGMAVAYTRRVLVNLATDGWRRRRWFRPVGEEATGQLPSAEAGDAFDAVEHRADIVRQLARLTPRERAMVVLRYYADVTEQQVADEFSVTAGTVKSTCSRALARLRATAEPMREGI